ncbi:2',3'-cyclic-nucleotide 3'-phosphodiesterase-like [Limulus polyphemus]|uniref:2',3'-cyclic-nucleotide 3'-phosphodiesterase n=1 Tax=Limulus polyphemus TaxID=6850 RepID=A0ABM1RZV8_LIMPO|nr:2',3'-cyclic-nucleotide 3'-phosphodiesterase-like [Limulus polyphemus]XP_022236912.1 2',3'-cyclic-nucleotide 3'-phosphodiesterase-like [Limulus polyphemus]XP_022236913.1 2',3'-cyclic-nucleotide 3'-phosphodiesterase-like [Limulus polyphemus]
MVIMRGLPGSGKSYIVSKLEEMYGKSCIVCSADQYFCKNGIYRFERSKLDYAHKFCQEKAERVCRMSTPVVIIDNTNVRRWEMDFYRELAHREGYIQLFVEPKTPWKFDPEVLASKNSHGIATEMLQRRLEQWELVHPLYFGWFLNHCDSLNFLIIAKVFLENCMKVEKFFTEFQEHLILSNCRDIYSYYSMTHNSRQPLMLHCTAKFCGSKQQEAQVYLEQGVVQKAYGAVFELGIVGFVITPSTFGARVSLTKDELELWCQNDYNSVPPLQQGLDALSGGLKTPRQGMTGAPNRGSSELNNGWNFIPPCSSCIPTLCTLSNESLIGSSRFQPVQGRGKRAHITLGLASGSKAVQTGFDLLEAVELESKCGDSVESFSLLGGVLRSYGEGMWIVYLDRPMLVNGLFSFYVGGSSHME